MFAMNLKVIWEMPVYVEITYIAATMRKPVDCSACNIRCSAETTG